VLLVFVREVSVSDHVASTHPPLASVITLASELQNERALLCSAESSE